MLDLLQTFCSVAEIGSLNKATDVLHLTQPAITRQIKLLEHQLGVVLLIRSAQGVRLTPAGEAVLRHARQAVAAVAACRGAAATFAADATERLRIAAGMHVAMYCLPDLLAEYQQRWPSVKVDLQPSVNRYAVQRLLQYEADVALIAFAVAVSGVRQIPLFPDPLVLVAPPGAEAGPASLAELEGSTLLVLPPGSVQRREIDEVLERHALTCTLIELPGSESIRMGVRLGMGSAIMPRSVVRGEARLTIRQLRDWPGPERLVRAVVRAEGSVPEAVRNLLAVARSGQSDFDPGSTHC
ncbi:MAG TPA: LysR family transcriptional regulator [Symbiobacteriaceae bacterium]|jgi:DNA-binding transcriptional LysR family regulator